MSSGRSTEADGCPQVSNIEELMVNQFRAYVSPILSIVGIITNIITMIVFIILQHQSPCRFNLYTIWLSFCYNIQLVSNCFLDDFLGRGLRWATNCHFWIQVDVMSSFSCKVITFLSEFSALTKAFILMYFSADRVFSVYYPTRVTVGGGLWYAHGGIFGSYVLGLLLNTPQLIYVDRFQDSDNQYSCGYVDPVNPGVKYVLYLYIVGATLIPSVFIFVTNLLILCKMWFVMKRNSVRGQLDRHSSNELSKIIAHLAISVLFELLSLPIVVGIILRQQVYILEYDKTRPVYAKRIIQLTKLFSSMDCINYAFDFFIFLLFMPTFRQVLWNLCKCSKDLFNWKSADWSNASPSMGQTMSNNSNTPTLCKIKELSEHSCAATLNESSVQTSTVIITRL
ncbi:unnamed protein product [Echinostoma caproni]|uniref:G_PROTEIN_RECEP_F1_2 domain-containing protein n=1 Tax=Echinostoma caproni TaxID=27848 RepID=A0A183A619_9TREM|nr:unnamed protein product [Echinostoma caproni]